ncbi:MAG: DUF1579 domain-containing protein [Thermoanaerobaculia bacterium]
MEMRKIFVGGAAAALLLALAAVPALANGDEKKAEQPAMSAEEQAMMAAWQKAMTPGPQHQQLASAAGSWTFTGKFWMGGPDKPPMEASGTAERSMMHGGRVLVENVRSEMMGQPFEGHGMTGYDNVSQKYWTTWTDNMGTGVMVGTGTCDASGCTYTNEYYDPMTGQKKTSRSVLRHEDGREIYEAYDTGPDGKEYKSMELVMTRKG